MPQHTKEEQLKRIKKQTLGETVTEAREFLRARGTEPARVDLSPQTAARRLSGESPEDFTQRIAETTTPGVPAQPTAAVGVSDAARIKEKAGAFKEGFGIPDVPVAPSLITPGDLDRAKLARGERTKIETELESILEERLKLEAEFRGVSGRTVAGVTEAGRRAIVTEKGREVQEQLDALNRREQVLEIKLRNRTNTINEIMKWQQQGFANAVTLYNSQFGQAIQLYNLFDKEADELEKDAKASLDIVSKAVQAQIETGKFDPDNIPSSTILKIEELETQAGLPVGSTVDILKTLRLKEEKLYSGVNKKTGTFTYITKDADGNINIVKKRGAVEPEGGADFATISNIVSNNPNASYASLLAEAVKKGVSASDAKIALEAEGVVKDGINFDDKRLKEIAEAFWEEERGFFIGVDREKENAIDEVKDTDEIVSEEGAVAELSNEQKIKIIEFIREIE